MSLSGPKVLEALDAALRDIRREEGEILNKLGRSAERVAKIRETEGELLREFAAGRLPPQQELELSGRLIAAQNQARQNLQSRAAEMQAATDQLVVLDAEFGALIETRAERLRDIDRQQAALRGLSARIAAAIARDRDYIAQQQNLERLKTMAAAARAKARQADIDREQKGRPYRSDPLFIYLLDRGYGTSAYKGGGFTASLDGWVAKLVDFAAARQNFAMLNAWPGRLRRHAEQQAEQAAAAERMISDIEQRTIDSAGGGTVRAALAETQGRIEAIDARLLAIQDERDTITAQQTGLVEVGDAAFDKAITALVIALGSPDLSSLIGMTRRRSPNTDAALLAQLDDARLRVEEERTDTIDERMRLKTLAARRRSIEDIEYEFKVQKFDDPRSIFRDDDVVEGALSDLLTGTVEPKRYWDALLQAQSWTIDPSDLVGGMGLPRFGRQPVEPQRDGDGFNRPRAPSESAHA